MIELRQLSRNLGIQEYEMLQGIINGEYGFMNDAYGISYEEYKEWLIKQDCFHIGKNMPPKWIPYTTFFLYDNGIPIGYGRIRHSSNEYLKKVVGAGEIGYGISKKYRGMGYGNILFQKLLEKCKEFGYKEITLFPYIDNKATIKIMLKNGGEIIGKFKKEKFVIKIPIR